MRNLFLLAVGLVLIANFAVLMIYGDTLQSTRASFRYNFGKPILRQVGVVDNVSSRFYI